MDKEKERSRIDIDKVKIDVVGKWRGILESVGVYLPETPKDHGPCPICGPGSNSHRFRFDDIDGTGSWICTQCGSGDGWSLYQKHVNADFIGAAKQISSFIGHIPECKVEQKPKKDPKIALVQVWKNSKPIIGSDQVSKYLRSRKLMLTPENIRFGRIYESETKTNMPAMVGVVMDRAGKCVSLHRTYLSGTSKADLESPKKLMPATDSLSSCGAAIRLFKPTDVVGVSEGIETAIACKQLFDIPTWATISTSIMVGFEPPEGIRKVVIFGDNDANFSGQKHAYILANKLYNKNYIVEVQIPEDVGDWADHV